jgi:hypothetical protein
MRLLLSLPFLVAWSGVAWAGDDGREDFTVWGDLFARWDHTRWFVSADFLLPDFIELRRDENLSFDTREFVITMVYGCTKFAELSKQRMEVECKVEDFGMRANIDDWEISQNKIEKAQVILDEIDAKLTGAAMSLQVADDGRVMDIGLDGVPQDNRRVSDIQETLRQLLMRTIVGFHLRMQKYNQLDEGKWLEYNSTIMNMPGTTGSNEIVHQLNRYRGHVIVQSVGKGLTTFGGNYGFTTEFSGVALFDDVNGFMTERVWTLFGNSIASSGIIGQKSFFHSGRVTMLGSADQPDCGATEVVNGRAQKYAFLPDWTPHEE